MEYQGLDLAYETKSEMGWSQEYAVGAVTEYMRWLKLRASANDFVSCKLSPSRAVAVVWNVHRQWTQDYVKTCNALGGFIHHYPPAVRLGVAREHAYAATYHQYKEFFNEDPPSDYWGAPISDSRGHASTVNGFTRAHYASDPSDEKASPRATLRTSPRNDRTTVKSFTRSRRKSGSVLKNVNSSDDVPSTRVFAVDMDAQPLSKVRASESTDDRNRATSSKAIHGSSAGDKTVRITRGGRKVQEGLVLKPLPSGTKRKRGRPSLSEYMPVSKLADINGNSNSGAESSADRIAHTPSGGRGSSITKRRRGGGTRGRPRSIAPRPSDSTRRSEVRGAGGSRPQNGDSAKTPKAKTSPRVAYTTGPDGTPVLLKRPRGRPRKDGSWPIPRVKTQASPISFPPPATVMAAAPSPKETPMPAQELIQTAAERSSPAAEEVKVAENKVDEPSTSVTAPTVHEFPPPPTAPRPSIEVSQFLPPHVPGAGNGATSASTTMAPLDMEVAPLDANDPRMSTDIVMQSNVPSAPDAPTVPANSFAT